MISVKPSSNHDAEPEESFIAGTPMRLPVGMSSSMPSESYHRRSVQVSFALLSRRLDGIRCVMQDRAYTQVEASAYCGTELKASQPLNEQVALGALGNVGEMLLCRW